jgi:type II secretory pathway component GspD/PulD (secretin)
LISREDSGQENLIRLAVSASNKDVQVQVAGATLVGSLRGNEVQTQVVIPNGTTFVLGGLLSDNRLEGEDGIPGLRSIPLLGALFRAQQSTQQLDETIFFQNGKAYLAAAY